MSTTYPTTKQELTSPTTTSKQNNPSHSTLHSNLADTVEAIEDKLGITSSLISGCGGLYPGSDSTTALKFCQSDGSTSIITIDTVNKLVGINTTPVGVLHILASTAGRPFIFGSSIVGSFEGATTEAANKINAPSHGLSPTVGDLLIITSSSNNNEGIYYISAYDSTYITLDGSFLNTVDTDIDFTIIDGGMAIEKEDGSGNQYIVGGFLKYRSLFMEYGTNDAYSRPQLHLKTTNSIIRIGSFQGDGDGIGNCQAGTGLIVYGGDAQGDTFDADNYGYAFVKSDRFGLYNDQDGGYAGYLFRVDLSDNEFYLRDNSGNTTFAFDRAAGELEISSKIGILTTQTLVADLTIEGTGGENMYIYRYGNTANPPSIKFWKARGTVGSPTVASDADDAGKLEFWAYARNQGDTADAFVRTGVIISEVDGVDAQGRIGGKFSIYTSPGVSITPSLVMSITKDSIIAENIATATAGTQYNSYDFKLHGSVWDTDNVQAEDRYVYMRVNSGSGADGSEPYDLTIYDNSDNALMIINPLTPTIQIQQYLGHIGDPNTALEFGEDRFKILCGGVVGFDFIETGQDAMYIGNGALGVGGLDIDIYIGTNNAITIAGDTGWLTLETRIVLSENGNQQVYSYEGSVADEGTIDLPDSLAGFVFITFDEGAEWAACNITDGGVVTLFAQSSVNVDDANTDGKYCVFDNGTAVRVSNRIGSTKNIKIIGFIG